MNTRFGIPLAAAAAAVFAQCGDSTEPGVSDFDWSGTIAVATLHIVVPAVLGVIWHRQRRRTAPEERRRP